MKLDPLFSQRKRVRQALSLWAFVTLLLYVFGCSAQQWCSTKQQNFSGSVIRIDNVSAISMGAGCAFTNEAVLFFHLPQMMSAAGRTRSLSIELDGVKFERNATLVIAGWPSNDTTALPPDSPVPTVQIRVRNCTFKNALFILANTTAAARGMWGTRWDIVLENNTFTRTSPIAIRNTGFISPSMRSKMADSVVASLVLDHVCFRRSLFALKNNSFQHNAQSGTNSMVVSAVLLGGSFTVADASKVSFSGNNYSLRSISKVSLVYANASTMTVKDKSRFSISNETAFLQSNVYSVAYGWTPVASMVVTNQSMFLIQDVRGTTTGGCPQYFLSFLRSNLTISDRSYFAVSQSTYLANGGTNIGFLLLGESVFTVQRSSFFVLDSNIVNITTASRASVTTRCFRTGVDSLIDIRDHSQFSVVKGTYTLTSLASSGESNFFLVTSPFRIANGSSLVFESITMYGNVRGEERFKAFAISPSKGFSVTGNSTMQIVGSTFQLQSAGAMFVSAGHVTIGDHSSFILKDSNMTFKKPLTGTVNTWNAFRIWNTFKIANWSLFQVLNTSCLLQTAEGNCRFLKVINNQPFTVSNNSRLNIVKSVISLKAGSSSSSAQFIRQRSNNEWTVDQKSFISFWSNTINIHAKSNMLWRREGVLNLYNLSQIRWVGNTITLSDNDTSTVSPKPQCGLSSATATARISSGSSMVLSNNKVKCVFNDPKNELKLKNTWISSQRGDVKEPILSQCNRVTKNGRCCEVIVKATPLEKVFDCTECSKYIGCFPSHAQSISGAPPNCNCSCLAPSTGLSLTPRCFAVLSIPKLPSNTNLSAVNARFQFPSSLELFSPTTTHSLTVSSTHSFSASDSSTPSKGTTSSSFSRTSTWSHTKTATAATKTMSSSQSDSETDTGSFSRSLSSSFSNSKTLTAALTPLSNSPTAAPPTRVPTSSPPSTTPSPPPTSAPNTTDIPTDSPVAPSPPPISAPDTTDIPTETPTDVPTTTTGVPETCAASSPSDAPLPTLPALPSVDATPSTLTERTVRNGTTVALTVEEKGDSSWLWYSENTPAILSSQNGSLIFSVVESRDSPLVPNPSGFALQMPSGVLTRNQSGWALWLGPLPQYSLYEAERLQVWIGGAALPDPKLAVAPHCRESSLYWPEKAVLLATLLVDPDPVPETMAQKAKAAVTSAALAASAALGGTVAVDAQALVALGLLDCTSPAERASTKNYRLLAPTALKDSLVGMVTGNFLSVFGFAFLQGLAVLVYRRVRGVSTYVACSDLSFPGLALTVSMLTFQGTGFAALRLLLNPADDEDTIGNRMVGIVALGIWVSLGLVPLIVVRKFCCATYSRYVWDENLDLRRKFLRLFFPPERWVPYEMKTMLGLYPPFGARNKNIVLFPMFLPTWFTVVGCWRPASFSGCIVQMYVLAVGVFGVLLFVAIRRPFRGMVDNFLAAVSLFSICGAVVVTAIIAQTGEATTALSSTFTFFSTLQTIVTGMRVAYGGPLAGLERFCTVGYSFEPLFCWVPASLCGDHRAREGEAPPEILENWRKRPSAKRVFGQDRTDLDRLMVELEGGGEGLEQELLAPQKEEELSSLNGTDETAAGAEPEHPPAAMLVLPHVTPEHSPRRRPMRRPVVLGAETDEELSSEVRHPTVSKLAEMIVTTRKEREEATAVLPPDCDAVFSYSRKRVLPSLGEREKELADEKEKDDDMAAAEKGVSAKATRKKDRMMEATGSLRKLL